MKHMIKTTLIAVGTGSVWSPSLLAQSRPTQGPAAANPPIVAACSLISKEEVKRHLPWRPQLDQFDAEEEQLGSYGSACEYPSVRVQVMPFVQATIDNARKKSGIETVGGVGDEAYLYNNANRYAELYVKVGARLLTLQANVSGSIDEVRPGVVAMAKVLVAKLR
jgi:hypothetical protein